jgi:hypothetical protein
MNRKTVCYFLLLLLFSVFNFPDFNLPKEQFMAAAWKEKQMIFVKR